MLREKLLKRHENLEEDNKKLKKSIELIARNNYLTDKINNLKDEVTKDQAKICDMLNKFNGDMGNNVNNLYEKVLNKKMIIVLD